MEPLLKVKLIVGILYLASMVYITIMVLNRMSQEDPYDFLIKGRQWWVTIVYSPLYPMIGLFFWDAWKWVPCAIRRSEYEEGYNSTGKYFSNGKYVVMGTLKVPVKKYLESTWYYKAVDGYMNGESNDIIWGSTFFVDWLEMCVTSELIDLNRGLEEWVKCNIVSKKRQKTLNYMKYSFPALHKRSDCYIPRHVLECLFYQDLYKASREA